MADKHSQSEYIIHLLIDNLRQNQNKNLITIPDEITLLIMHEYANEMKLIYI